MRTGINPVTIRGTDNREGRPVAMTLGRLHIGTGGGKLQKFVSAVMYDETGGEPQSAEEAAEKIKAFAVLDEEIFVSGLMHLFPVGEFDHAPNSEAPSNGELIELLKESYSGRTNRDTIRATLLRLGVEL